MSKSTRALIFIQKTIHIELKKIQKTQKNSKNSSRVSQQKPILNWQLFFNFITLIYLVLSLKLYYIVFTDTQLTVIINFH